MPGVAGEIRQALEASADDATRRKYERIVPGAEVLGVRVPEVRAVAARVRSQHPELTLDAACALLDRFARRPIREEMLAGIFVLARFGKAVERVHWARIAAWTRSLDNWEVCDQLAANIAARVVHANPKYVASLTRLATARNPWVRRFALATAADLTHAGRGDVAAALKTCRALLADPDPMIQTAIGWALREASKADGKATFAFLKQHAVRMRPRTLRDAAAKLPRAERAKLGVAPK